MAGVPAPDGPRVTVRPCPVCGAPVAHDAIVCPSCGTSLQHRRGPDLALVVAGVLAVAVGVLLALLLTRDPGDVGRPVAVPSAVTAAAPPAPTTVAPAPTATAPPGG